MSYKKKSDKETPALITLY